MCVKHSRGYISSRDRSKEDDEKVVVVCLHEWPNIVYSLLIMQAPVNVAACSRLAGGMTGSIVGLNFEVDATGQRP